MNTLILDDLYAQMIIVYVSHDGTIGIDYATSKEEFEELLMYHEDNTTEYRLIEIKKEGTR
jgi:hypothetical protein